MDNRDCPQERKQGLVRRWLPAPALQRAPMQVRMQARIKLIHDNKATKVNEFELATRYPKVAQYLTQIKNVYRKFSRGEKLKVSSPLKDQPKKAFEYDK